MPQTLLLTALALLIGAATIMLACEPGARPVADGGEALPLVGQVAGGGEEPAAEPTTTPTPNPKYPKLHSILQNLVRGFEAGNLTEILAAAQAPLHYYNAVLVKVDVAANIDAIDTWMERQSISARLKVTNEGDPYFYAYVPVSLLGALSRQSGVTLVEPSIPPWADLSDYTAGAAGAAGSSGNVIRFAGTPTPTPDPANLRMPEIPIWLQGAHPYPRLQSPISGIVYRYERGEITEAAAAAEIGYNYGSAVIVDIYVVDDPAKTDAIVSWLNGKDVIPNEVLRGHVIVAYIPVSVLGELSNQPGVTRILGPQKPSINQESPEGPQGAVTDTPTPEPAAPTDTPTSEVLAKAAMPVAATPEKVAPQETENTESPEPTAAPTPRPTVCLTRPDGPDICVPGPAWGPEPTPKYPKLGAHYSRLAVEAEEAVARQASGVSGPSAVELSTEYVEISLTDKASAAAVADWLSENRVPTIPNWRQGDKGYIVSVGDNNIFAVIPIALLEPLSRQRGFAGIINGCRRSLC